MTIFSSDEYSNNLHKFGAMVSNLGNVLDQFSKDVTASGSIELGFINFLMQHLEVHRQSLVPTDVNSQSTVQQTDQV